jgi:hypothetical protein
MHALASIVDSPHKDTETESSISVLSRGSFPKKVGPVVQSGMNAAFAMRKSGVQIPIGPFLESNPCFVHTPNRPKPSLTEKSSLTKGNHL